MTIAEQGAGLYEIPQEMQDFQRDDPPDRDREDRPAGGRDRPQRRVPVGRAQAARRAGHPRPALRRGLRRHRNRDADAADRGRGDRQGLRLERPDPDGAGAGDAADPALRLRGAEAAVAAALRERRVVAGLRSLRAGGRLRPGLDAHHRGPRRRGMGDQRPEELDHQRRRSPTSTSSSPRPTARTAAPAPSSSRKSARASTPASSSTSSGSRARRPARPPSPTSASPPRT